MNDHAAKVETLRELVEAAPVVRGSPHMLMTDLDIPVLAQERAAVRRHGPEIIIQRTPPLNWATLDRRIPPPRRWAVEHWIGMGHAHLLPGVGGVGKTLLAQTTGSALALGRDYLAPIHEPLVALLWACEDDHDELWRRQVQIAAHFGVPLSDFAGKMIVIPRVGLDNALLVSEYGRPMWTPAMTEIEEMVADYKVQVLFIDNVGQACAVSENDRASVTQFVNRMAGIGQPAKLDTASVLLAHPSRAAGAEFSGSSAWENTVRLRLYLGASLPDTKPEADEPSDDARYLCKRKANYTAKDYRRLTLQNGVLVPDPIEAEQLVNPHHRKRQAERVAMGALRKLIGMGKSPTDGATSPEYLPKLVMEFKLNDGLTRKDITAAMRELMVAGTIKRTIVGEYGNRMPRYGLVEA